MGHPFFDAETFPWHHPDAVPAQQALLAAYPQFDSIDTLYRRCAPGLRPLSMYDRPEKLWKDALEGLTAARALRRLCDRVLEAPAAAAAHGAIRRLVNATGSSTAPSSTPRPAGLIDFTAESSPVELVQEINARLQAGYPADAIIRASALARAILRHVLGRPSDSCFALM